VRWAKPAGGRGPAQRGISKGERGAGWGETTGREPSSGDLYAETGGPLKSARKKRFGDKSGIIATEVVLARSGGGRGEAPERRNLGGSRLLKITSLNPRQHPSAPNLTILITFPGRNSQKGQSPPVNS